jgi:hypothetical protein
VAADVLSGYGWGRYAERRYGDDLIDGGAGADTIDGGGGVVYVTGGATRIASWRGAPTTPTIVADFSLTGGDRISTDPDGDTPACKTYTLRQIGADTALDGRRSDDPLKNVTAKPTDGADFIFSTATRR